MCDIRIIAVAIKIPIGLIYSEDLPSSHYHVLDKLRNDVHYMRYGGGLTPDYEEKFSYGYLLSDGSFVDRFEGMQVAIDADQLKGPEYIGQGCLYSYDLRENH